MQQKTLASLSLIGVLHNILSYNLLIFWARSESRPGWPLPFYSGFDCNRLRISRVACFDLSVWVVLLYPRVRTMMNFHLIYFVFFIINPFWKASIDAAVVLRAYWHLKAFYFAHVFSRVERKFQKSRSNEKSLIGRLSKLSVTIMDGHSR